MQPSGGPPDAPCRRDDRPRCSCAELPSSCPTEREPRRLRSRRCRPGPPEEMIGSNEHRLEDDALRVTRGRAVAGTTDGDAPTPRKLGWEKDGGWPVRPRV